jgi:hypothetical protein
MSWKTREKEEENEKKKIHPMLFKVKAGSSTWGH